MLSGKMARLRQPHFVSLAGILDVKWHHGPGQHTFAPSLVITLNTLSIYMLQQCCCDEPNGEDALPPKPPEIVTRVVQDERA